MNYELEIKQIVDYPRCRIYRDFIQTLLKDRNIRTNGSSYLFYYMILCSYANFRSSYRRLDGISYIAGPGEWICTLTELKEWFRTRFQHQAISILGYLQDQHYITYRSLSRGNVIKFTICDWRKHNTAFEYNYPCLKDEGFFFFPIASVHELISMGRCSEMDIVLDLWVHAIYNDEQVRGSELGPVVYFRNCSGNPLISYNDLADRWGISKATVCRILNKLRDKEYISMVAFTGRQGSIIYLCRYLSTMFDVCDVMIDKEEVAMHFKLPVHMQDITISEETMITDNQILIESGADCVSSDGFSVSESDIRVMVRKLVEILVAQGVSVCESADTQYKLYPLSDCSNHSISYTMIITAPGQNITYRFDLSIEPSEETDIAALRRIERRIYHGKQK